MNIIIDNIEKLNKYKLNPPHPSYIAGLIDGDGNIFIRKIKDGYQSGIAITQSRTNILNIIRYHFGGELIQPSTINIENKFDEDGFYHKFNKRNSYTLIIRSNEYRLLLDYIKDFIILKKPQMDVLYEFSKLVNKINMIDQKEELCKICLEKNNNKKLDNYDISKLNIKYIQGLFDAEGFIFLSYKKKSNEIRFTNGVYMKLTQKNHPDFIPEINKFLGYGKMNSIFFFVDNFEDCLKFIKQIKSGLIVKYNQIIAFEDYLNTKLEKSDKYNNKIHLKRMDLYKIINMEKHQIEIYNKDDYKNFNLKEEYEKKMNEYKIQENIDKKLQTKLIQSEKKKGVNNPNYGHHLEDDHALNISISTTNAKRAKNPKLSNDNIREIYKLKDKGILQKDISEKYGMNRNLIRLIWNKSIMATDDEDFINHKKELVNSNKKKEETNITFEQKTSIGKRILEIDEIIEILQWKEKQKNREKLEDKKIFSTNVAIYLSKKFNKKVTNDIIKNIWSGRTSIFEFEFKDKPITYEKYMEIVEK
jgi:hypothetical protein